MNWLKAVLAAIKILPAVADTAVEVAKDVKEVKNIVKEK